MDGRVTWCSATGPWWREGTFPRLANDLRFFLGKVQVEAKVKDRFLLVQLVLIGLLAVPAGFLSQAEPQPQPSPPPVERHLANIRQLTSGRQNAEAYFSFDGTKLIFQSTNNWTTGSSGAAQPASGPGLGCYQMYVMDLDGANVRLVSTGTGATTCGYFFPGDRRGLYVSTHLCGPKFPPQPPSAARYAW